MLRSLTINHWTWPCSMKFKETNKIVQFTSKLTNKFTFWLDNTFVVQFLLPKTPAVYLNCEFAEFLWL